MKIAGSVIRLISSNTGEIKSFGGNISAHKYMLEHPEYIVYSGGF